MEKQTTDLPNTLPSPDKLISNLPEPGQFLTRGAIYALDGDRFCVGWDSGDDHSLESEGYRFLSPQFFFESGAEHEWIPENQTIIARSDLDRALQSFLPTPTKSPSPAWRTTRDEFVDQFVALKDLIASGAVAKGVPYGQMQAAVSVDQTWVAKRLQTALREGSSSHLYGIWDNTQGLIGCSPERLCEYSEDTRILATEAVAGTTLIESYQPGDLLNNGKAVREHNYVVDDLIERLSDLGVVEVGQTVEQRFPGLIHLRAPLQVLIERTDFSMREIVRRLHPTAALGVYPRNQAGQSWLRDADQQLARWRFGAPFGINHSPNTGSQSFSCLVAIRNVQWRGHDVRITAGCGVIKGSELECEWQECLAKIQSIRNLLGL